MRSEPSARLLGAKAIALAAASMIALGCGSPITPRGSVTVPPPTTGPTLATLHVSDLSKDVADYYGASLVRILDNVAARKSEVMVRIDSDRKVCFMMDDYRRRDLGDPSMKEFFSFTEEQAIDNPYDGRNVLLLETSDGGKFEAPKTDAAKTEQVAVKVEVRGDGRTVRDQALFLHYFFTTCFESATPIITSETQWLNLHARLPKHEDVYKFSFGA